MNWEIELEKLEKKLKELNCIYTEEKGTLAMMRKIILWEELSETPFEKWNKHNLMSMCENGVKPKKEHYIKYEKLGVNESKLDKLANGICNTSYYVFVSRIKYSNTITKFLNRDDLFLNVREFNAKTKTDISSVFTKEELIDICDSLVNIQDKFILYALFSGIRGNKYSDLVELKETDINFETKEITLKSGNIIKMDEYLEEIITDLLDPKFGCFYYRLNRSGVYDATSYYKFNMESPYVIKVMPQPKNNMGIGFMSFQGIQTRLKGISSVLDKKILGLDLYKSGVVYNLYKSNPDKKHWTQPEIEQFIKDNNYSISAYEAQRSFTEKYYPSEE